MEMRSKWWCLWCCILAYSWSVNASAPLHYRQQHPYSASKESYRIRSNLSRPISYREVIFAARKAKKVVTSEPEILQEPTEVSFDDLGPLGKVVAATTELGVAIVWNYCQGYLTGFIAGTAMGLPGFLFRPVESGVSQALMTEMKGRFVRMNVRSVRFGKNFGGISAIFKGSDVAVRRLRYGKNDEWNDIFGSAVAGAIFARKGKSGEWMTNLEF